MEECLNREGNPKFERALDKKLEHEERKSKRGREEEAEAGNGAASLGSRVAAAGAEPRNPETEVSGSPSSGRASESANAGGASSSSTSAGGASGSTNAGGASDSVRPPLQKRDARSQEEPSPDAKRVEAEVAPPRTRTLEQSQDDSKRSRTGDVSSMQIGMVKATLSQQQHGDVAYPSPCIPAIDGPPGGELYSSVALKLA